MIFIILILASLFYNCSSFPQSQPSTSVACNNSPSLCSRSYSSITHLGAHDSPFVSNNTNGFTSSGNQFFNSTTQLDAGVRLLTAQLHTTSNTSTEIHLCHSDCGLYDAGTLVAWLSDIKTWMDANPYEVVTILLVNSMDTNANELSTEFVTSGIAKYAYTPTKGAGTWPTLSSMIQANTRLVTFIASLDDNTAAPYLLDEFSYVFENPFEVTSPSNFSCMPDRPTNLRGQPAAAKSSGRLFLMNHFLDKDVLFGIMAPDVANSPNTNSPDPSIMGSLGSEIQKCNSQYGGAPNFVLVDWFNVGPAITSVDGLNNVSSPVGRKTVTSSVVSQSTFTGGSTGYHAADMFTFAMVLAVVAGQYYL